VLRVEEIRDGEELVVRAELPGIGPKDVEVTVADGVLRISAHWEENFEHNQRGQYRSESRSGSFTHSITLPTGTDESRIETSYDGGVLEVRVPLSLADSKAEARVRVDTSGEAQQLVVSSVSQQTSSTHAHSSLVVRGQQTRGGSRPPGK